MSGAKGKPTFTKTEHYFVFGKHVGIASERNPETHRILRKALSPAFSPKSIREHDVDCHKVVDLALTKLERRGAKGEGANVSEVSCTATTSCLIETDLGLLVVRLYCA